MSIHTFCAVSNVAILCCIAVCSIGIAHVTHTPWGLISLVLAYFLHTVEEVTEYDEAGGAGEDLDHDHHQLSRQ
jgi:hypothetical protein